MLLEDVLCHGKQTLIRDGVLDLVFCCWLLVGQRLLVGMGSGRKRLNILGVYCPDDHEYIDYRLTRDNINGEQFVNFMRLLRSMHPEVERFILYVDGARYYDSPVVKAWLKRHPGAIPRGRLILALP